MQRQPTLTFNKGVFEESSFLSYFSFLTQEHQVIQFTFTERILKKIVDVYSMLSVTASLVCINHTYKLFRRVGEKFILKIRKMASRVSSAKVVNSVFRSKFSRQNCALFLFPLYLETWILVIF